MKIDLGLQLYSLRNIAGNDAASLLAKVKKAGYDSVEFAGFYNETAESLRKIMDQLGLKCHSTHTGFDEKTDLDELIRFHKTLGAKYIIIPYMNWESEQKLKDRIRFYNEAGRKIHEAGLQLLYHNHSHEFTTKFGGRPVLDILREGTAPESLGFELDVYWAFYAGQNPVEVIKRFGPRMKALHLKDMKDLSSKKMTECGTGIVDLRGCIKAAADLGISTFVMEQDDITIDPVESVAISARNIKKIASEIQ